MLTSILNEGLKMNTRLLRSLWGFPGSTELGAIDEFSLDNDETQKGIKSLAKSVT